jgi:hypothetical protein
MRAILLPLVASALLPACGKRTVTVTPHPAAPNTMSAGMFIDKPGAYHFGDHADTHDLDVTLSGQDLGWSASSSQSHPGGGSSGSTSGGGIRIQAAGDPWFIFVEAPGSYWICNGRDRLDYDLRDGHGSNGGPAVHDGKLIPSTPKVPVALIPRLPAEMQKLLPAVEPPRKRPSI